MKRNYVCLRYPHKDIIIFTTVTPSGEKVKHRIFEDDDKPGTYIHLARKLVDSSTKPITLDDFAISERIFFSKKRMVEMIHEGLLADTWYKCADAVKTLERIKR